MSPVNILATHLPGGDIRAMTLVFKTLRVGFPTAQIVVWGNDLTKTAEDALLRACEGLDGVYRRLDGTSHDKWIERLIEECEQPFWICDTDVVFFDSVEDFKLDFAIAGRFEPGFIEPWTGSHKVPRIHTCLMRVDPYRVRQQLQEYVKHLHPKGFPFLPEHNFYRQYFVPRLAIAPLFFDTCAGLYQAIGGQHFTTEHNKAFEHLHCGSYAGRIKDALPGILSVHERIFENPASAKGLQLQQNDFYIRNAI